MFTIKVINRRNGKVVQKKGVQVNFNSLLGGFSKEIYIDKKGEVHFVEENSIGSIFIDGKVLYEGHLSGRRVVYL